MLLEPTHAVRVASNVESRVQEEERKEGGIDLIDELPAHSGGGVAMELAGGQVTTR